MSPRSILSSLEASVGPELLSKIQSSKILVIGSGGIGCELLKNLALSSFTHVQVVDLDTIDVSNLNRQLLFRSQHVGMPKCTVACEVATNMAIAPQQVSYQAHHGNVCDNNQFNVQFVSNFDLVLNALDNVTARRRVNRLCLAAKVPLIEAGTTGYLGQVSVIDNTVACYECKTQETQKVYPICTIRSTPSMPVHTIVWAKECYKLLYGDKVEESMLFEADAAESSYMQAVLDYRQARSNSDVSIDKAKKLMTVLYQTEIHKQLDMDRYKAASKTPVPLDASIIASGTNSSLDSRSSTEVWSLSDCIGEFLHSLLQTTPVLPAFDKDDDFAMAFVTAASNMRNYVFGIDVQSLYAAKGIAGNIIPAIATTNAICAGLQILQAFMILKKQLATREKNPGLADCCSYLNCVRNAARNGLLLTAATLDEPNPKCFVCRNANISLHLNVANFTLEELLQKIIKADLGFEEPTLMLEGDVIWEEGDDADIEAFRPNLHKQLTVLPCGGIRHGTVLLIEDFSQDLTVQVTIHHQDVWPTKDGEDDGNEVDPHKFVLGGDKPCVPVAGTSAEVAGKENGDNGTLDEDDDDDIEVLANPATKRRSARDGQRAAKRPKMDTSASADVIEVE